MQYVSKLKADGILDCEFIVAESEHSQFEIVKHASAVGARTFCGSSGVGWFYAFEAITVTAGLRLPVVAMVGNRALDDPGAFGVEHNDALAVRDLGWMLYWVATAQEALDIALMAWRIAEESEVFLPFAISCDGSFLTHSQAIVNVPTHEQVQKFLPAYDRGEAAASSGQSHNHRAPGKRGLADGDPASRPTRPCVTPSASSRRSTKSLGRPSDGATPAPSLKST